MVSALLYWVKPETTGMSLNSHVKESSEILGMKVKYSVQGTLLPLRGRDTLRNYLIVIFEAPRVAL